MRRPSPALVISIVALVFAMGGTGWAVTQLPKNSVGTPQLKKSAVTSPKIKDGTIAAADLSAAAREALRGQKGDAGAQGATGAQGAAGAQGPSGVTGMAAVSSDTMVQALGTSFTEVFALVPASASGFRRSTGGITVDRDSRLVITFTAVVDVPTSGSADPAVTCLLALDDILIEGSANGISELSRIKTRGTGEYNLAGTGSTTVSAGTYDVSVKCLKTPAVSNQVDFLYGTLTVIAAAS